MGRRLERLNEQLRRELSELLLTEVKDPRVGPVTVTGVRTTSDLAEARVMVSTPGEEGREETMEGLRAAAPFLRTAIAARLEIRHAPELRFEVDTTLDHARRIEDLLREVRPAGGWPSDDEPVDEGGQDGVQDAASPPGPGGVPDDDDRA